MLSVLSVVLLRSSSTDSFLTIDCLLSVFYGQIVAFGMKEGLTRSRGGAEEMRVLAPSPPRLRVSPFLLFFFACNPSVSRQPPRNPASQLAYHPLDGGNTQTKGKVRLSIRPNMGMIGCLPPPIGLSVLPVSRASHELLA